MCKRIIIVMFAFTFVSCGELDLPEANTTIREEGKDKGETTDKDGSSGSGTSATGEEVPPPSAAILVDAFPAPCSLWQDHVVVLVEAVSGTRAQGDASQRVGGNNVPPSNERFDDRAPDSIVRADVQRASASSSPEALVTLLSLYDWAKLPSALNEANSTLASSIAQSYQEYDLAGWRIPTAAEAKALKAAYTSSQTTTPAFGTSIFTSRSEFGSPCFESLNALLLSVEASELQLSEGTTNARYLCEQAQKTFSFAPNTTISTAGAKATNYRLRLVKTLRLKIKS